jgi:hypothetical protein
MAIRRRKTKSKTGRILFKTGFSQSKKKRGADLQDSSFRSLLKVLAVIFVFAAIGVGFVFLDKYVKRVAPAWPDNIQVELVNPPDWINASLKEKITAVAKRSWKKEDVKLEEDTVRLALRKESLGLPQVIQSNLERDVAWLKEIRVRTTHDKILIEANYRKPIALVKRGLQRFYVDAELVVLDFVPMANLPIVNVRGLAVITSPGGPQPGETLQQEDLAAAVAILVRLDQMDKLVTPDKPLLFEIDTIDVSNFKGRQSGRLSHINLYTKDNTVIIWGAEIGAWAQHLEAKDEEKLAKLYNYYKEYGSLTGGAKYIDLRTPQGKVPLPIDKY